MRNEYLESLEGIHVQMHPSLSGAPILNAVKNSAGKSWAEVRVSLRPRFWSVYRDIAVNFTMVALVFVVFIHFGKLFPLWATLPAALWAGFWWHTLLLFTHEAAHFNIAPSRKLNDFLGNILFMPFVGIDTASYREVHWQHHLHLGDDGDTEFSYINPLSLAQILIYEVSGLNALQSIGRYLRNSKGPEGQPEGTKRSKLFVFGLFLLAACQGGIILALWLLVSPQAGATWAAAFWVFTPLYNKIRQTIEHRSMYAGAMRLLSPAEQGPVLRLFGKDLISSKYGEAGFNRHLLHHWDPAIPYTRLDDMEAFFMDSDLKQVVLANKSTYISTFLNLTA
jgi:fatty acid desaturase